MFEATITDIWWLALFASAVTVFWLGRIAGRQK